MEPTDRCPECDDANWTAMNRRSFVHTIGVAAAAASIGRLSPARAETAAPGTESAVGSESLVAKLFQSMDDTQRRAVCFNWDHRDERGLLRLHVENNWSITKPTVASGFFNSDQQEMIEAIFWGLYNPEWKSRIRKQLQDDAGGYGKQQSIAIFGEPGTGKFEFVMTGRHLTIRCDGDSTEHTAFGGPVFYGHAAQGFNEKPDHPGNVFWPQSVKANKLFEMLDGRQRKLALVGTTLAEEEVHFQGSAGEFPGIPVVELSSDQKQHLQSVMQTLIEPYRASDQAEALRCLEAQGGLEKCSVAFFELDDIGNDKVWDTWRVEGPSFVWHFRGNPHVHCWVNVASDPGVKIST